MSSSQQFFGNKYPSKAPERSNFAHTCNLLSQYVKEKGSLKELNLTGLGGKLEAAPAKSDVTTMDLLNKSETLGQCSTQQVKPVDPFPRFATVVSSRTSEEDPKKDSSSVEEEAAAEPKRAQMTIFYAGKVLVFDDFPAEKAREIMLVASNESAGGDLTASEGEKLCSADAVVSSSMAAPDSISTPTQEGPQPQPQTNNTSGSDLPIARRSSLHRFLEKRKDRNVARGPYQAQNAQASSSKNDEQLELKL